jgi:hypothetical protein
MTFITLLNYGEFRVNKMRDRVVARSDILFMGDLSKGHVSIPVTENIFLAKDCNLFLYTKTNCMF